MAFDMVSENSDQRRSAYSRVMDLCCRIERMCRYSPLDNKEVDGQSMQDRKIVEGLYYFYKNKEGDDQETAARKARANAIWLILNEVLT